MKALIWNMLQYLSHISENDYIFQKISRAFVRLLPGILTGLRKIFFPNYFLDYFVRVIAQSFKSLSHICVLLKS